MASVTRASRRADGYVAAQPVGKSPSRRAARGGPRNTVATHTTDMLPPQSQPTSSSPPIKLHHAQDPLRRNTKRSAVAGSAYDDFDVGHKAKRVRIANDVLSPTTNRSSPRPPATSPATAKRSATSTNSAPPTSTQPHHAPPPPRLPIPKGNNNTPEGKPAKPRLKHKDRGLSTVKHELHKLEPESTTAAQKGEARKLRSHETPRFKSDLSAYFPDYDEIIGNNPKETRQCLLCSVLALRVV